MVPAGMCGLWSRLGGVWVYGPGCVWVYGPGWEVCGSPAGGDGPGWEVCGSMVPALWSRLGGVWVYGPGWEVSMVPAGRCVGLYLVLDERFMGLSNAMEGKCTWTVENWAPYISDWPGVVMSIVLDGRCRSKVLINTIS